MTDEDRNDEETTAKPEVARRRAERRANTQRIPVDERERLRLLHYMRCPKCGQELDEITFRDVKVDKCFSCGGVFLDDGELEQLAGKAGWFEGMRYFFGR